MGVTASETQEVIRVEHLSKAYRFGEIGYGTLYREMQSWWARLRKREDPNARIVEHRLETGVAFHPERSSDDGRFLALDDVSFSVRKGETVGIIGRNGAGKSTLLKILSQVTAPTQGAVKLRGRVTSLLEVGTGFHPELSGRENVYLNGAILGMSRAEVTRKLPDIVDFAEIGHFIDTPVKRYSSGMYVRLAFAVAAHLEPDILILDEVLAVGDVKFVKKCMEKMQAVRDEGRTILLVTHGMASVLDLCPRSILLDDGKVVMDGPSEEVIRHYTGELTSGSTLREWSDDERAPGIDDSVRLLGVRVCGQDGKTTEVFDVKEPIIVEIRFRVLKRHWRLNAHIYVAALGGPRVFVSMDNRAPTPTHEPREPGYYTERCTISAPLMNEGSYSVEILICTGPSSERHIAMRDAVIFSVTDDMSPVGVRGDWDREWPGRHHSGLSSFFRPDLEWRIEHQSERTEMNPHR